MPYRWITDRERDDVKELHLVLNVNMNQYTSIVKKDNLSIRQLKLNLPEGEL